MITMAFNAEEEKTKPVLLYQPQTIWGPVFFSFLLYKRPYPAGPGHGRVPRSHPHPDLPNTVNIPMFSLLGSLLLLVTGVTAVCPIPAIYIEPTITRPFAIQVQNASYPVVHNRLMNLWQAGGGDQHLYLSPAGTPTSNLTLIDGVITRLPIRAVINGEVNYIRQIRLCRRLIRVMGE